MADMQRAGMAGKASMRIPLSGSVQVGGKIMKELRFMPYSEFPEVGREETLYIDTDGNTLYYYDGAYIALSGGGGGGGTGDYNELSNKPQINGNTLTGNKTASNLGLQETISDLAAIRSGAASGSTAVQPATLAAALATKQDVISDLSTIRSGAASGATAVQPSDMESALANKQDVIADLNDIRTGAGLGATAVQPADMETALADKQDVISDLDAIRSGATAGNTALQPEDIDTLPTDGSSNPVSSGGTYNFVNSSIATNTAYFIGTFASVAELEAYTGTVTNNDYAFVTSTDSAGNTLYNRYKYNAATQTWSFEYAVNNTAFTAAQWAAIQSGLTASDKTKLDGIEQGANKTVIDAVPTSGSSNAVSSGGVHTALSGKQDTISDLSDIRSGASAGATAVQPSALNDYQTKLSGTNKLDPAYIEYDTTHRAVTDTEKSTWSGKQDAISDLSTIRSGAAAGATALQQSDVTSTYSASGTAPVNGTAVSAAIGTLDVSSVGGSGKYISAISETNGKISATPTTFDTELSSSSTDSNVPTSKTVFDDQQRQDVEISVVANAGAKNLFDNNLISKDANISYTVSDGVYTVTSIGAESSARQIVFSFQVDTSGEYILSGCPSGGGSSTYELFIRTTQEVLGRDYGNGVSVQLTSGIEYSVKIIARAAYTNLIFKPMIRDASIVDSTFVPYAKTNYELTVAEVDSGMKNKVDIANSTTSGSSFVLDNVAISLSAGSYVFSYTSDQLTNGNIELVIRNGTTVLNTVTITSKTGRNEIPFNIASKANNIRLYSTRAGTYSDFMICTAADYAISAAYVPYALSNPVITPALIKQVDEGAKNLLKFTSLSEPCRNGVDFTLNSDGSVTVNGTPSGTAPSYVSLMIAPTTVYDAAEFCDGKHIISGCPLGGGASSYRIQVAKYTYAVYDYGSGAVLSPTTLTGVQIVIYIPNGVTVNNLVFRPMICTSADWAISKNFVPYAPTNRELYEMIQALQNT